MEEIMILKLENVQKQYKDFKLNCSLQVEEPLKQFLD